MPNMVQIEVSGANYRRLSEFAAGFNATPDSALSAVFAELDRRGAQGVSGASNEDVTTFENEAPPNLAFTNVRRVRFLGESLPHAMNYWNKVMERVIIQAAKQGWSAQEIIDASTAPMMHGEEKANGFHYLHEASLSVQGQDANGAWRQIHSLCKACGFSLEIDFQWQDKPKAALPGQRGRLAM